MAQVIGHGRHRLISTNQAANCLSTGTQKKTPPRCSDSEREVNVPAKNIAANHWRRRLVEEPVKMLFHCSTTFYSLIFVRSLVYFFN